MYIFRLSFISILTYLFLSYNRRMIVYIYNIGVDLYNGFNGLRHRINWTYFSVLDGLAHPLYSFKVVHLEIIMFNTFIIGNLVYYILGINLAFVFKDNRAFCKYICPATVFLKPASYFSFLRVKCNHDLCIGCQKCIHVCPMDVDMLDDSRKRKKTLKA